MANLCKLIKHTVLGATIGPFTALFLTIIFFGTMGGSTGRRRWLGIVIRQSLPDGQVRLPARIVAERRVNPWDFLLVEVDDAGLDQHIKTLQTNMVADDEWYAHYFWQNELKVVFRDARFDVTLDRNTWESVIRYGLAMGIPREQLDFKPATRREALQFFGLSADR